MATTADRPTPAVLYLGETLEPPGCRDALTHLDGIGHGDGNWDADKKMNVIRLDLLGDHRLARVRVDGTLHPSGLPSHRSGSIRRTNPLDTRSAGRPLGRRHSGW